MQKLIDLLENLSARLGRSTYSISEEDLIDTSNKLRLYLSKYFKNNSKDYLGLLDNVKVTPEYENEKIESVAKLRSIISTMLEDIELSESDFAIVTEEEKNKILNNFKKETEAQRKQIELEAQQIKKLNDELKQKQKSIEDHENEVIERRRKYEEELRANEKRLEIERQKILEKQKQANDELDFQRQKLMEQEEKFNSFKTKLEIADKNLDFQSNAKSNKKTALVWAIIAGLFTIILILLLCKNFSEDTTLSSIRKSIVKELSIDQINKDKTIVVATYIAYFRYIFSKLLIYSLLIYFIIFSVKNYNAQMHNFIVNTHKANAFKSTLSLLNTARSDEGNDKLLIQATQAIFSHQQSGYSGKDSEPSNPNLITNVFEAVTKKL